MRSIRFLSPEQWETTRRECQLSKDQAAFKRFVEAGLTPRHLRGSDRAEALAATPAQVEGKPEGLSEVEFTPMGEDS